MAHSALRGAGDGDLRSAALFGRLWSSDGDERTRAAVREELVRRHLGLVEHCARRFRHRGEPFEDLVQVGTIGLLNSIDRFDPSRGVEFTTYATPTILGELKRHFRDKGWAVRVPRRLQEIRLQLGAATAELTQALGRAPTAAELARHLGRSTEEVLEGLESQGAYVALSLDAEGPGAAGDAMLATLGAEDQHLDQVETRESVRAVLERLPARERRVLLLRFYRNLTQSEIAAELGISQMHVSRLLSATLERIRGALRDQQH